MASVNPSAEKIARLQRYIDKMKSQLAFPSPKHSTPDQLQAYKDWVTLDIKKAQGQIDKLKGV